MLAAASLFVTSSAAHAQNITKTDASKAGTITVDGNVTNILPDRFVNDGNTAINQFAKFELDKGNIANLQLERAGTLVNFVDSRASINGIVNAVKDNKIGGNMYFLSPKGIAVGPEGVINAGKVGMIVPHKSMYDFLLKQDQLSDENLSNREDFINVVALNPEGSIVVEGSINAPGGITLTAQNVNIKPGAKLLNTNTIDFSNLVNTVDVDGVAVSAGLDSDLKLTADENGGIYISARVDDATVSSKTGITDVIGFGIDKLEDPTIASINVGKGAEITSDADVTLSSTVTANRTSGNRTDMSSNFYGFESNLDVAGTIKAKNINLEASIVDKYAHQSLADGEFNFDFAQIFNVFSLMNASNILQDFANISNGYVFRLDKATINIDKTATLDAAKNIDVNADSDITTNLTSIAFSKDSAAAAALNATSLNNLSQLNIHGAIKAGGDINLNSTATTDMKSTADIVFAQTSNTSVSLGLNLAFSQNLSELNVSESADINAGGKLNVSAVANSPFNVKTTLQREGSGLGALTLSGGKLTSYALVNSEGTMTANGDVNISSKFSAPTYEIASAILVNNPVSGMAQTKEDADKAKKSGQAITEFINNSQSDGSGNKSRASSNVTTNAALFIADHLATVNLGKVTSNSGNVNIESSNVIKDPQIGAFSVTPVEVGGTNISPVVTYSSINNNRAQVGIRGDITAKNINIKSNLTFDNPRLEQVRSDILEIKPRLAKAYDSILNKAKNAGDEELNTALEEAKTRLDNYLKKIDGSDGTDPLKALTAETSEIVNDLKEYFADDENVQAIIKTLETATDATKVSTFMADRESVINSAGSGGSSSFSLAGAALINIMNNKSEILVDAGKNLIATNGNVTVDSNLKNVGLSVGGHILPQSLDTAATDIIVGVNRVNDVNTVTFTAGNALSGNNISITANNDVNHIYLNDGSGKGVNNSYRAAGTVSYADGKSQAIVKFGVMPIINSNNSLKINATNNTNLFNMAGGLSYGGGAASVGIGAAVNNYDVDTKVNIGDKQYDGYLNSKSVEVKAKTDGMVNSLSVAGGLSTSASNKPSDSSSSNSASNLTNNTPNTSANTSTTKSTTTSTNTSTKTTTNTSTTSNSTTTTGTTSNTSTKQESSGIALLDQINGFVDSETYKTIAEIFKHFNDAKSTITETKDKIDKAIDEKVSMVTGSKPDDVNIAKSDDVSSQESQPKVTFDGAGSVSVNLGSRTTESNLTSVEAHNVANVDVGAVDNNFTGAWSGAGALNFRSADSGKTSVAMTGAVAVNKVDSTVVSNIASTENLTGSINNTAEKSGALIAAGLGLTVSKASSESSNYTGAASANVNLSSNVVKAVLKDNTAIDSSAIKNIARNVDTQVTGGVNVSVAAGGKKGVAAGGTGVWSDISNDVNAIIDGGTYKTSGAFNNIVSTTLTDVAGGVGVSVAQGSESSYGFQGVFTYNKIKNNSHADIKNAAIAADSLVNSSSDNKDAAKAYDRTLTGAGLDVSGDSYAEFAKVGETDSTKQSIQSQSTGGTGVEADESVGYQSGDFGNKIITGALAVAGAGDGAAQASLAISDVDNDFKAEVTNSALNVKNKTDINATSNTLDINAAAGAAISSKGFGAGGSVSWQTTDNQVVAGFDGASSQKSLKTGGLDVKTENHALEVNVGGQVSGGKGNAAGLAMAYNALNDNTKSYVTNAEVISSTTTKGTVDKEQKDVSITYTLNSGDPLRRYTLPSGFKKEDIYTGYPVGILTGYRVTGTYFADDTETAAAVDKMVSETKGNLSTASTIVQIPVDIPTPVDVNVNANSSGQVYAVGAGVAVSGTENALNGSVAVNHGSNSTQAVLENVKADSVKNLNVNAEDNVKKLAVVGGLTVAVGSVAVGGSVAYNDVGTSDNQQLTKISMKGNDITASENVSVNAKDSSDLLTVGVGIGASSKVAVQGSAAVATLNKDVGIVLDGSTIKANNVSLKANTAEELITTADVLSVGGNVAVGAGVSVNNDYTKTGVAVNDSTLTAKNLVSADASNSSKVLTIGIGGSAGGTAAVTGSVAVNNLNTNTANELNKATVNANNGVLINAKGDEAIANYAGSLSVSGSGAAVGLSVSVNNINSNVQNVVNDSDIRSKVADFAFTVDDSIAPNALLNTFVEGKTFKPSDTLAAHRVANTYKGVVINANATHDIKSALFNGGVAGSGVAVNGTVNVNRINGSTASDVKNTAFSTNADVNVLANDFSNSAGLVGTASAAGTGAGVGLGSDSAVVNREVNASLDTGNAESKAQDVNVKSVSQQGVGSLIAGVGFAGAGAGASNGVGVSLVDGSTNASVSNTKGNFDNLNVTADHLMNLNTLGVSFGAAGTGAGVGLSVDVLKTKDKTATAVKDSDITLAGNAKVKATNNANVDYQMYDVGAAAVGAGLAGSIGVANVQNNVSTDLTNATLKTEGKTDIAAQNNLDFENKAAVGGLAGLGGGVGVGVSVNTIDSSVNANVNGGSLNATEIDVKSVEERNVNQGVGVASGGLGAASVNVMITNVGKELDSSYESDTNKDRTEKDGTQVDVNANLDKANDASVNKVAGGDNLKSGGMNIELVSDADKEVTAGGAKDSGTHVNISGTLDAEKISVNNLGTNNLSQGLYTGGIGGVSVNGSVGILNLKRNASTEVTGKLTANDLTINNQDGGTSEQEIMQGGFGLVGSANASYGRLNVTGKNKIKIEGGTLDATTLNISNSDDSKVNVESVGVSASLGKAIGVLIAEGSLEGSNEIEINKSALTGKTISISGKAAPEVSVNGLAVSASASFAGSGLFAGSINNSAAKISGDGSTFTSDNFIVNAENLSSVKTTTNSASGSLLASNSLTGILNKSSAAATVDFTNANINAPTTSLNADSLPRQKVGLVSLGAGGLLAANGSAAAVTSNPSATVNVTAKDFSADKLAMTATANSTPDISVKGYSVGAIAVGSNIIASARDVKADTSLKADNATLNTLDINAKTTSAPNLNVNGDGGGFAGISPAAAVLDDNLKQSAAVKLGGTLNVQNSVNVNAQNSDAGAYKADALGAAVVGASGVELKRNADSNANITFDGANITSGGSQTYNATNNLGYGLDLEAAGYGGLNASAGSLKNATNYSAAVNVDKSSLTATGETSTLNMNAQTTGNASSLNNLKAAGAVEVVVSSSDIDTTFDNQINVTGSTLTTGGNASAIRLATNDNTEQKYHTIANIQGGAAGIGVANTDNTLNRSNAVNVNASVINSANSVDLNSGSNVEGIPSKITMTALADVYNKTALPLSTAPKLTDDLTLNNTVDIDSGSAINAVRNVSLNAESGTEVVTESAKEYKIYSGESGNGKVVVTTGHEGNASETQNNFVNVDGTVNAGVRNTLKMTISGGKVSENVNPTVNVTAGAENFDASKINFNATASMDNPFLADYNKAVNDMNAYAEGTAEYKSLYNQVVGMERVMATYGFAEKVSGSERYKVYDKIQVPAMELPDISLAGGNIDINTPTLTGRGSLNANAAKELTINNSTERSLLVNNVTMDTAGGKVYLNDAAATESGNLKIRTQDSYTPAVTINNTGKGIKVDTTTKAPDIILNGGKKISNAAGSVTLNNTNGSVVLNGEIYSLTATKINTPNGGTIINNTGGLQNVGEDPLYKYTFGNQKFSDFLQEAIAIKYMAGSSDKFTYKTYKDYLDSVYTMAMYYNTYTLDARKRLLNDVAGSSSWYKGNSDDGNRWVDLMLAKYDSTPTTPAGAIVSGGAVSIIAKTLNINGLIQSGFNNYVAGTTPDEKYYDPRKYGSNLDDNAVIGDNRFRINNTDAETVYNAQSGMYDKILGLYYNPSTYHILTEPVRPTSGTVYLKAEDIISTGNGKIIAASGGADVNINIDRYPIRQLVVNDIDISNRSDPLIMINGVDYSKASQYLPNSKAVYAWTGGIKYNRIETKSTTAIKWGSWNIYSFDEFIQKVNNEKVKVDTVSTSDSLEESIKLRNGIFTDNSGDGNLFTISSTKTSAGIKLVGDRTDTPIYQDLDIFHLLPAQHIYNWTETIPYYAGSTYRINAAQPIKIQTTNKADSTIKITSEDNLIVGGNLATGTNGTVNLTSQFGNITTSGDGKITADKVNLNAKENIDVTIGLPESKTTELKATSTNAWNLADIKINANAALKNVDISDYRNVNIVGTDDISGKVTAKALNVTTPGNINLTTTISGKLTAQGDKSVTVTQTEGDLQIGKVTSKGDVSLAAPNGAMVNAVDTTFDLTGAADKIDAWRAAGLISDKDSANGSANAAREEKAVRLNGLENLFKQWALKDDGTVDETLYRQFVDNAADKTNLTAEQVNQLNLYQDLKSSNDYGFSQNQLLYSVQESLFNPKAGVTANINDPIITGKNITLNAKSFGKELAPKTYSNLTSLDALEKLAGAKGGDVTFNPNGTVTLTEQSPITVGQLSATDKLNVTTQGNTFISGTNKTTFNVNTPIDAGDGKVVLMTGNGIDASKGIKAKEVELYAGAGDINAKLTERTTDVTKIVTEPLTTTTITYSSTPVADFRLFDKYANLPGFSVQREPGFFERTYTLTATYNLDDADAVKAVKEADKLAQSTLLVYNYSRDDKAAGTRDVERTVKEKIGVVGTLTANAAGNININADASLPVKNITAGGNVNITVTGNIVSSDKNSVVKAPSVNLTATNDIASESTPLTIHADLTMLKAKYAYIAGDYGNLTAWNTKVIDTSKLTGTGGTPSVVTPSTPTINESSPNNDFHAAGSLGEEATFTTTPITVEQQKEILSRISLTNLASIGTARDKELYSVALALSRSSIMTNNSNLSYYEAAKSWLSGMGYSDAEQDQIIDLSIEISFSDPSKQRLLNAAVAEFLSKFPFANLNAKSVA